MIAEGRKIYGDHEIIRGELVHEWQGMYGEWIVQEHGATRVDPETIREIEEGKNE